MFLDRLIAIVRGPSTRPSGGRSVRFLARIGAFGKKTMSPGAGRGREPRHRAGLGIVAAGTIVLLLAPCSGGPTEEAAKHLAELCGTKKPKVPVQALPYDADSGEGVDGYVLGEATRGVVFSNQTDTYLCDWLPFAKKFSFVIML